MSTSIILKIKADQLEARKGRATAKAALLTTLLGEASIVGKNAGRDTTDEETVAVVKKFIKNIQECINVEKDPLKVLALNLEKDILGEYLPKQLTSDEIADIVQALSMGNHGVADLKTIMAHFKQYYSGQFNGKDVADAVKNHIVK
jgi:uncharacterized protein YqeY